MSGFVGDLGRPPKNQNRHNFFFPAVSWTPTNPLDRDDKAPMCPAKRINSTWSKFGKGT